MLRRLLPKETNFFDFFEQHVKLSLEACREMDAIASNNVELMVGTARIKEVEHRADKVTHQCLDALHRTFITPIDRADIHQLIKRLDDIIDSVDSAASRMTLYEMINMRPEMRQFTQVLLRATTEVSGAIEKLRHLHREENAIQERCQAIYDAEKEGDRVLRSALARLFREEKEPVMIIKWKEIFERMEKAIDRCENVANIIEGIVIEAS